jgi:putative transposase
MKSPLLSGFPCNHLTGNGRFTAKQIIHDWIGFYNSERPHTALGKRTQDIAYFTHAQLRKAT